MIAIDIPMPEKCAECKLAVLSVNGTEINYTCIADNRKFSDYLANLFRMPYCPIKYEMKNVDNGDHDDI